MATGCDQVFIGTNDALLVEPELLLPIVTASDIRFNQIVWSKNLVINPFSLSGGLIELASYPRLMQYLLRHEAQVRHRHVAQKNPRDWYRTIDRIYPVLIRTPKLLVPDIKDTITIAFDEGQYYPHHNLYFITSTEWDIRVLQGVLMSDVARLFLSTYAVTIRGGYLRCQAQYIRRIRVPAWSTVSPSLRQRLRKAAVMNDRAACTEAAFDLYELGCEERKIIRAALHDD